MCGKNRESFWGARMPRRRRIQPVPGTVSGAVTHRSGHVCHSGGTNGTNETNRTGARVGAGAAGPHAPAPCRADPGGPLVSSRAVRFVPFVPFVLSGIRAQRHSCSAAFALSGIRAQRHSRSTARGLHRLNRSGAKSPTRNAHQPQYCSVYRGTGQADNGARRVPSRIRPRRRERSGAMAWRATAPWRRSHA